MKKIFALLLSLMLVFSLAACGGGSSKADNSKIKEYIEKNEAALISSTEQSFAATAGTSCDVDVEVKGMGIVITLKIHGMDNVSAEQKAAMSEAYDSMSGSFESALELMQKDLPELEYYQFNVCEEDGDLLATVVAGDK